MERPEDERTLELGEAPDGFRSGFASIVGRPNVGKSTLLNQLLRSKVAITSDRPQTTRNAIRGVLTTDRAQIVFVDTPGLHKPRTELGTSLNRVVRDTLSEVDVVIFVVDAADGIGSGDAFMADELRRLAAPVVVALNKSDLLDERGVVERTAAASRLGGEWPVVVTSGRTGTGTKELVDLVAAMLPEGPLFYPPDTVTDQPERHRMADVIREKLLEVLTDEVPHSVAVVVDEVDRSRDAVRITATIYVERDSQKGIVVGRGGRVLRDAGTAARRELETIVGRPVYLDQRVKVAKDWQRRRDLAQRFGYGS